MKARNWSVLLGALWLLGSAQAARAELAVVATTPDLAALASEVGGDEITVEALVSDSEDPHFADARPSLVLALNDADLLIVNGLELEVGWLPTLITQARNAAILVGARGYLDASTLTGSLLEVPSGRIDRSMGDIHPGGNPHFTIDPRRAAAIAVGIGQRLGELDPEQAATYAANAESVSAEILAFAEEQSTRFGALSAGSRTIVAYHRSLPYLCDWLGLEVAIEVEPLPGIAPDPGHVATVLTTMRSRSIGAIVQEEFYPRNTSETLAQLAGADLVVLPGGTRFESGERYLDHLRQLSEELYDALAN
jgi:zinc/manganese transport system substrate-binding protein